MHSERCLFCDQPATRLCDRVLGLPIGGVHKAKGRPAYKVTTMEAMLAASYTCDAPCCPDHARVFGHVCGSEPDTFDECLGCQTRVLMHGPPAPARLMEPAEIVAIRKQRHAEYRRMRMLLVR